MTKPPKGLMAVRSFIYQLKRDICKFILENLQDQTYQDNNGITPLHTAAYNGHLEVYKVIMDLVVDKNPRSMCHSGYTPLHSAAHEGHLDICEVIVKYAAEYGHLEVCKFLMKKSSEINPRDNFGDTPLGLAKKNRHFRTACFITKYLANQKFQANQNLTTWLHVKLLSTCHYLLGY